MTLGEKQRHSISTARVTGVWYLLLAISGMLGFLVLHPQIYVSNDPEKTLTNLTQKEFLAQIRLLLEFTIVISQALAAVWFYKLFRSISEWEAWAVGIWGMINATVIMLSAISMGSSIEIANSTGQSNEEKIVLIRLLGQLIKHSWGVGGLFFGLWLMPMGHIILRSKCMPVWLGRILILGGIGYILNTFINYSGLVIPYLEILVIPASVGEFWMIGYLLFYGIRPIDERVEKA